MASNNNDFFVELNATFNKASIADEYEAVKKKLTSDPIVQKVTMDTALTKQAVKDMSESITTNLNNAFKASGIDNFSLSARQVESILTSGLKNATKEAERLNKQLQTDNLSAQTKYYSQISKNIKEIYTLKEKLINAGKTETSEINKQIKLLEKRNSYNNKQLEKKNLKDNSLEREINNTKVLYENRLKLNKAKVADTSDNKQSIQTQKDINSIDKLIAKTEEARKTEERRQQLAQSNAINKNLEEEYAKREKINNAIASKSVSADVSKVTDSYNSILPSSIPETLKSDYNELINLSNQLNSSNNANKTLVWDDYTATLERVKNQLKEVKSAETTLASESSVAKMALDLRKQLKDNSNYTADAKNEIRGFIQEIKNGGIVQTRLDTIATEAKRVHQNMAEANKTGLSFGDSIKQQASKFTQWVSVSSVVMASIHQLKEGAGFIANIDDALTNINYTMDVTKSQLKYVADASLDMSKNLKASANNVLDAVKFYANANDTAEGIVQKAQATIMFSNSSGIGVTDSAKSLLAVMNQFDMSAEEITHISDVLQKTSMNMSYDYTSGLQELISGIETAGATAKESGYNIEKFSSLLGVLIQNSGLSGSTLSNSLRTMMTRVTKASTSALAGGEVTSDDLSNAETSLRRVGIEVRSDNETFKDFDVTMGELYNKLDSLSQVDLANIGYEVAGVRNVNTFRIMVKSYGEYLQMLEKVNDSEGTTLENQDKYAQSLQGHLGELKATTENIWSNLLDSDELKGGVDLLNGLLTVIEKITGSLGGLGTLSTVLAGIAGKQGLGLRNVIVYKPFLIRLYNNAI